MFVYFIFSKITETHPGSELGHTFCLGCVGARTLPCVAVVTDTAFGANRKPAAVRHFTGDPLTNTVSTVLIEEAVYVCLAWFMKRMCYFAIHLRIVAVA
jgi:hypothetical protein